MRVVVAMGVGMVAILGIAFALNYGSDGDATAPQGAALPEQAALVGTSPRAPLEPREVTLGRALVIHVDGEVPDGFADSFQRLDADTGAFDRQASPRTLMDVDVYVMVRDDWDVFRNIEGHDLGTAIRQRARGVTSASDISYFQTQLTSQAGGRHDILAILATQDTVAELGPFCLALVVRDMARFAHHGTQALTAQSGPGTSWRDCKTHGWTSMADIPAQY